MNEMLFEINSAYVRGTPWISMYRPKVTNEYKCHQCGFRWAEPVGGLELIPDPGNGTFWPDLLGCGDVQEGILVSERVLKCWCRAEIPVAKAIPATVNQPYPRRLKRVSPPPYFLVIAKTGVLLDAPVLKACKTCGQVDYGERKTPMVAAFRSESWNGLDLFAPTFPSGRIFCTAKVIKIARAERHTNFRFIPVDALHSRAVAWKGIDYLGKCWPPKSWYPNEPCAGKSAEELVDALFSGQERLEAVRAIQERKEAVVPALARAIRERRPQDRLTIAGMLEDLERKGVSLDTELLQAIETVHKAYVDSITAMGEEAVPSLIYVLKSGVSRQRKFAALALRSRLWTKHADKLRGCADLISRTLKEFGLR
jgi:hypothetical protein